MARRCAAPTTSGFLNIDKPPGWTSHDVVGRVRRIVGERGVGHAGTLDPAATGVLPIAVGYATRLLPFLENVSKTYIATIRLGVETDSGDRDGRLVSRASADHVTEEDVKATAARFVGVQDQTPPMHSAIRVDGRRLYEVARQGGTVDIPVRRIEIHRCGVVAWDAPDARLQVSCSKGTYIRSLARDIGRELGCGATLVNLVRVRAGAFSLASSVSIHELESAIHAFGWEQVALHPDFAMSGHDIAVLTQDEEQRWFNGQEIGHSALSARVSVYNASREWIGVGSFDAEEGHLRPKRVIRETTE